MATVGTGVCLIERERKMRKKGIAVFCILLLFCVGGCKEKDGGVDEGTQREMEETEENGQPAEGGEAAAPAQDGGEADGEERGTSLTAGLIENQSFVVEMDGWGKTLFASIAPETDGWPPHFALSRDGEIVYRFPETGKETGDGFVEVCAVAFQDYNQDGKQDVAVLVTYTDGERKWNEPQIFLQENSDNMFYLDHPDLESYRIDGKAEDGPGFYRDTFLEEYVSSQGLTDTMSELLGSWADYVEYADSLLGMISAEKQVELFAENREIWAADVDFADERHCFTLATLAYDGCPVLIVANQGGTGRYTYSTFYKIDPNGELKKMDTSFAEGESQPDLMEESMAVYSSFSPSGVKNHFIVYDELRDSPDSYGYRVSSLCLSDDFVLETPLAEQRVVYTGEDGRAEITSYDCNGNALTEEEYDHFADTYYGSMGLTKKTAVFQWIDVGSLEGMSDSEAAEALRQAYAGFSLDSE